MEHKNLYERPYQEVILIICDPPLKYKMQTI